MKTWNDALHVFARNTLVVALLMWGMFSRPTAYADAGGDCHFHGKKEATQETVLRCSEFHRKRLAKRGKMDSSWAAVPHESIEKVTNSKGKQEWRVVFTNPSATDESKKKLFMFFSIIGNFLAANHSGN